MTKIPAKDVKLIPHRWAMHAMQALSQRDAELLTRAFKELGPHLPERAIDTHVQTFGCGAPLRFHDYGFFDASASDYGTPLVDAVTEGDTLLLLSLRRHDATFARALIACGASLEVSNAVGETPLEMLYDAFAGFQLTTKRLQTDANSASLEYTPAGQPFAPLAARQIQYEELFSLVRDRLERHHTAIRAHTESELERIYAQRAPDRLAKIDAQMADFEFRERELLRSVQRKYEG